MHTNILERPPPGQGGALEAARGGVPMNAYGFLLVIRYLGPLERKFLAQIRKLSLSFTPGEGGARAWPLSFISLQKKPQP